MHSSGACTRYNPKDKPESLVAEGYVLSSLVEKGKYFAKERGEVLALVATVFSALV